MNAVEMGKAGLTGVRGKVANAVASPVAKRTSLSRDQILAIIGGIFLLLTLYRFFKTVRRVWGAGEED